MVSIDLRTVMVTGVFLSIVCTLIVFLLWRSSRKRYPGTGLWVTDLALQTLAMLMVAARGIIPDWLSIGFTNPLAIAGAWFGYMGLTAFVGKRSGQRVHAAIFVLLLLWNAYFVFIHPDISIRNVIVSVGLMYYCGLSARILFRTAESRLRNVYFGTGFIFAVYAGISLLRIGHYFYTKPHDVDFFQLGAFDITVMIVFQLFFVLLTYGMVMLVNKRLFVELMLQEEKFSKSFQSSPYAIILTRISDGRIIEVNSGFERITGYSSAEVLGRSTLEIELWTSADKRMEIVQKLMKKGRIHDLELQLRKKTGDLFTGMFYAETIIVNREELALTSFNDVTRRKKLEEEREAILEELRNALSSIKTLSGLIPICARCKKVRDDKGYWNQVEEYIMEHSDATFSHGVCPECAQRDFPTAYHKLQGKE
jgi:PAS domain S-box-containing protein